jgi:hypothetical protein
MIRYKSTYTHVAPRVNTQMKVYFRKNHLTNNYRNILCVVERGQTRNIPNFPYLYANFTVRFVKIKRINIEYIQNLSKHNVSQFSCMSRN